MIRMALAGNPNSGKTTLFNALTGATARVGNWPGVTVERKEGIYKKLPEHVAIVDLPGIYSLSPYTPEEVVSRNYLVEETPDVIINIVDATNLERNLYLTTQVLETDCPVIVALNMMDLVNKKGEVRIDVPQLRQELGVPVVEISALRSQGLSELMEQAFALAGTQRSGVTVVETSRLGPVYRQVIGLMREQNVTHPVFHAVKMLEGDGLELEHHPAIAAAVRQMKASVPDSDVMGGDWEAAVADIRYKYITDNYQKAIRHGHERFSMSRSDKADKVLTNRWLGIPIFLLMMFAVFHITFGADFLLLNRFFGIEPIEAPGVFLQSQLGNLTGWLIDLAAGGLEAVAAPDWLFGLLIDGMLAGLDAVLSFLPQILMLFLFIAIMEDTGYMARAAFIMDRLFRRFGLSGKSFMPLLMCFGCMVPGAMATRTLENMNEKRMTIFLAPFFSCGAKLPIWAIFAAAVFPTHADLTVFCVYVFGIVIAVLTAFILKHTIFKGDVSSFILELPAYHAPRIRNIVMQLWDKLKHYVYRAATIIAGALVVIWFLGTFNFRLEMVDPYSAESILGVIGSVLRPIFIPLGFASGDIGWKAVVATITGLLAKEMVVSTMGVLYNPDVEGDALEDDGAQTALLASIASVFSPVAALSFMAFNLLSVPCMAAVAAAHGELGGKKWTALAIGFWIVTAWVVSFLIYQIGSLFVR